MQPQDIDYDYLRGRFSEPYEVQHIGVFKDVNYAADWDVRDYDWVRKQFAIAQAYNDMGYDDRALEIQESLELKLIRMLDGQYVQDTPTNPKPMQAAIQLDAITNNGLVRLISINMGKTNIRFTHYASGDGTATATVGDQQLQAEKFRISMSTDGFMTAAGTVGRYGAVFIPSAPSHTVTESGVVDVPTAPGGTFLNRTLYSGGQRIVHTIFEDFFTLSLALYTSAI